MVGPYLDPPDEAVVVRVDEKSQIQIQALDRTAPTPPTRPGPPASATRDDRSHGTTSLFAALEVATGRVEQSCPPRHRHQELLRFLKQVAKAYPRVRPHVVRDDHATHEHPAVKAWPARNLRTTLHLTPTSGSWLNTVETFFGIITRRAVRRGTHRSVRPAAPVKRPPSRGDGICAHRTGAPHLSPTGSLDRHARHPSCSAIGSVALSALLTALLTRRSTRRTRTDAGSRPTCLRSGAGTALDAVRWTTDQEVGGSSPSGRVVQGVQVGEVRNWELRQLVRQSLLGRLERRAAVMGDQ